VSQCAVEIRTDSRCVLGNDGVSGAHAKKFSMAAAAAICRVAGEGLLVMVTAQSFSMPPPLPFARRVAVMVLLVMFSVPSDVENAAAVV